MCIILKRHFQSDRKSTKFHTKIPISMQILKKNLTALRYITLAKRHILSAPPYSNEQRTQKAKPQCPSEVRNAPHFIKRESLRLSSQAPQPNYIEHLQGAT